MASASNSYTSWTRQCTNTRDDGGAQHPCTYGGTTQNKELKTIRAALTTVKCSQWHQPAHGNVVQSTMNDKITGHNFQKCAQSR